jgi:NhaP-type Na+/H+ or K+/H+ antiporter
MYELLAIFAVFVFLYSITAGGISRTPISGAILFTAFGLVFGPFGLRLLDLDVGAESLRTFAELTLALVLFTDAANADLRVLRGSIGVPQRLLLIGLPLTILLGFGTGLLLFDGLGLLELAILATMLAPTDAALGAAVVSNESVPAHIRQGLSVESGLNDGICVPILFLFLALATESQVDGGTTALALSLVAEELGIGLAVGLGLTAIGTFLLKLCGARGWVTETWRQLPVVALALGCFALAQYLGGSGFIASFTGGLLFGSMAKQRKPELLLAAEGTGETLGLVTWVIFGAAVVGKYLDDFTWEVVVYAVMSLTVVRMVPVLLSLVGSRLGTDEKLFISWFGPRGMASIVFGVIVLNEQLPGGGVMTLTVVCTILLSVLGHGLSANPLVAALANRAKRRLIE